MTPAEKIRQQLNAEKTILGYRYGGPANDKALTDRLVSYLVAQGVEDIRDVASAAYAAEKVGVDASALTAIRLPGWGVSIGDFDLNLRTFKALDWAVAELPIGELHWNVRVEYTKDGYPIFVWFPQKPDGSFFEGFFAMAAPVMPVIGLVLAFAVPGAGAALGQMILGPTVSAAVPGLAAVVGNTAIGTALNGGDIESALKGNLIQFAGFNVGAGAGALTLGVTGSEALAAVATRVTAATLTGGDPEKALIGALAQQGAQSMWDFFDTATEAPAYDFEAFDAGLVDPSAGWEAPFPDIIETGGDYEAVFDPSFGWEAPIPVITETPSGEYEIQPGTYDIPAETPTSAAGEFVITDAGGILPTSQPTVDAGFDWDKAVEGLSSLAIGALKVYQTWQKAGKPAIQTPGVTTTSSGSVIAPRKDGMLVTTTAAGRVTTGKMPVGKPYLFEDGSIVTNNGDGTYTTISANGTATTQRYPVTTAPLFGGALAGIDTNTLMLGGLGLLAVLMLTQRAR